MDLALIGLVIGIGNGLLAVGLVMIFMSNRVINLAHGEFGALAVAIVLALYHNAGWGYWPSVATALACVALLAFIIERTIVQRLFESTRLTVLVATLGLAQLMIVIRLIVPKPQAHGAALFFAGGSLMPVPLHFDGISFGRVVIQPGHVMALIVGPVAALGIWAFLRLSPYGVALRAAAENAARARLLGIPVRRVSTIAWVLAALLSAVAALLLAPVIGYSSTEAVGLPLLTRGLTAATVARFRSVGTAFGVGLAIGVIDYGVFFTTGRSGYTDILMLVIIMVALLAQRPEGRRTDAASDGSLATPVRPLPAAITQHPRWQGMTTGVQIVGAMALTAAPLLLPQSSTFFLATVFLVACVGVSLTMLTGWGGHLSIGQWALAGTGAVVGSMMVTRLGLPFWVGLLGALVAGGLGALLIGIPALRLEGISLAVVTLGFAVAGSAFLFDLKTWQGSSNLARPGYLTNRWYYVVGLAALILTATAARSLQQSRVGRNIVAVRDNQPQAASYGVEIVRTKLTVFVVSGVIAGGAGFLWAAGIGGANGQVFEPVRSMSLVAVVVIGGLGSITGGIVGAFYMLGIPYFGGAISPYIGLLATGIGLLTLVLVLPGGLARVIFAGRDVVARLVTGIDPRPKVQPVGESALPSLGEAVAAMDGMAIDANVAIEEGVA